MLVFCSYGISLKTARLTVTLGSYEYAGTGLGYIILQVWALCVLYAVSRVHVPCVMRYFFLKKKGNKRRRSK